MTSPLHPYTEEHLSTLATPDLWQLLIRNEDRVSRNMIDECVRRGEETLDLIADMLQKDYYWTDDVGIGESWLPLHAAMILGLMSSERAGELLLELFRHAGSDEANSLEWIGDGWPALFRNKSATVLSKLRADEVRAPGGFPEPWAFYTPEAIAERQLRWAEEDLAELNRYGEEPGETYVREGPKIGRNDPCPCGSGRKYKKCCGRAA